MKIDFLTMATNMAWSVSIITYSQSAI